MKQSDRALAHSVVEDLLAYAKVGTMRGIYERLAPGPDGRIRTFQAPITETGRLNSKGSSWFPEPTTNLQNLPKKTARARELYQVRSVIVPDPGQVFVFADLGQAELYAYLAFAGDWDRIERLEAGVDEHAALAAEAFGVPPSNVTKVQRDIGKMGNYSLGFGGGWSTFMRQVNKDADLTGVAITAATAKRVVAAWRRLNPLTVRWWDKQRAEVARTGKLRTPSGRVREFLRTSGGGNDVIAHAPQSLVADHLNDVLCDVYERYDPGLLRLHLQVHDELVVQCDEAALAECVAALRATMTKPVVINGRAVTIPVELKWSPTSWQDKRELRV